ncbi:hypothetical protein ABZY42_21020 [Streptomyces sp. NPDC006622]|uniref:hypothetical protein n=1 Tax=Streptomyces sp. NPDC006622 TaxID=3155459 RepID=UPI0033ADA66A
MSILNNVPKRLFLGGERLDAKEGATTPVKVPHYRRTPEVCAQRQIGDGRRGAAAVQLNVDREDFGQTSLRSGHPDSPTGQSTEVTRVRRRPSISARHAYQ